MPLWLTWTLPVITGLLGGIGWLWERFRLAGAESRATVAESGLKTAQNRIKELEDGRLALLAQWASETKIADEKQKRLEAVITQLKGELRELQKDLENCTDNDSIRNRLNRLLSQTTATPIGPDDLTPKPKILPARKTSS